jgi:hypothetical protein
MFERHSLTGRGRVMFDFEPGWRYWARITRYLVVLAILAIISVAMMDSLGATRYLWLVPALLASMSLGIGCGPARRAVRRIELIESMVHIKVHSSWHVMQVESITRLRISTHRGRGGWPIVDIYCPRRRFSLFARPPCADPIEAVRSLCERNPSIQVVGRS